MVPSEDGARIQSSRVNVFISLQIHGLRPE